MFKLKGKNGKHYSKSSERLERINFAVGTYGKNAQIEDGYIGKYETLASFSYPQSFVST